MRETYISMGPKNKFRSPGCSSTKSDLLSARQQSPISSERRSFEDMLPTLIHFHRCVPTIFWRNDCTRSILPITLHKCPLIFLIEYTSPNSENIVKYNTWLPYFNTSDFVDEPTGGRTLLTRSQEIGLCS